VAVSETDEPPATAAAAVAAVAAVPGFCAANFAAVDALIAAVASAVAFASASHYSVVFVANVALPDSVAKLSGLIVFYSLPVL